MADGVTGHPEYYICEEARVTDQPRGAHLVGSVPLGSPEQVFRTVSEALGGHLRRIPDGETGERSQWVGWQGFAFKEIPQFELVKPVPGQYPQTPRFRVRNGADIDDVSFGNLQYADEALASFEVFQKLQEAGTVHPEVRFQVSLPTPLATVAMFVTDDAQTEVEPLYEARLLDEVRRILDGIPHDWLALQWDVAIEMWMWEGWLDAPFDDVEGAIIDRLARISDVISDDVELGFHLCYGDYDHEHFHEPDDAANLADVANRIGAAVRRPVQWLHLPVPIDRTDDAYFEPLRSLSLHPETELYVGLVHFRDGVEGTRSRIDTARRHVSAFGVATECGMGRRPPERGGAEDGLQTLLRTHAEVSAPIRK